MREWILVATLATEWLIGLGYGIAMLRRMNREWNAVREINAQKQSTQKIEEPSHAQAAGLLREKEGGARAVTRRMLQEMRVDRGPDFRPHQRA